MSDLISRSAVMEIIDNTIRSTSDYQQHNTQIDIRFAVEELPTVEARRTGYWRESDGIFYCSECNNGYKNQPTLMGRPMFEYCPMCGSKTRNNGASRSNDGVENFYDI